MSADPGLDDRRDIAGTGQAGLPGRGGEQLAGVVAGQFRGVQSAPDAAAVLEIIRDRGRRGLPLERLYRCLFNSDLFLLAYAKICRNAGAMTPGATDETVDRMTPGKIEAIIGALRAERYRWTPMRRTYIAKKTRRTSARWACRPGRTSCSRRSSGCCWRAYYEPQFSGRSHGFRPGRGCHTALLEIVRNWRQDPDHPRADAGRPVLGYEMVVMHADDKHDHRGHRSINAGIGLKVPADVIRAKCAPYLYHGKPIRRTERIIDTDFSIVAQFQAEYRSVAEYYRLAVADQNAGPQVPDQRPCGLPPLPCRPGHRARTPPGPSGHGGPGRQAAAGRAMGRHLLARDTTPRPLNDDPARIWSARSEIVQRLMADECGLCGSRQQVEVHHIRALKDLNRKGKGNPPEWAMRMAARRRKTLVVCRVCHDGIHTGNPPRQPR